MKEEKIIIKIDKDGKIEADAEDFSGSICVTEMQKILEEMPPIENTDLKPEYYKKDEKATHKTITKR